MPPPPPPTRAFKVWCGRCGAFMGALHNLEQITECMHDSY